MYDELKKDGFEFFQRKKIDSLDYTVTEEDILFGKELRDRVVINTVTRMIRHELEMNRDYIYNLDINPTTETIKRDNKLIDTVIKLHSSNTPYTYGDIVLLVDNDSKEKEYEASRIQKTTKPIVKTINRGK